MKFPQAPSILSAVLSVILPGLLDAADAPREDPSAWWSVQPIVRPAVPQGADASAQFGNPIDAFIAVKLREKGLAFSAEADRRTLIRRLSFDLLGLPPSPEEVKAFISDQRSDAYEQLVDRLLASPRYGERWAQHWLDIAHYADTHGFERDQRRDNAWRYRDYVIDSLNADKPYDQFLREQIAGDALAPEKPAAVIATGFLAAGPWDYVGQVEAKSDMLKRAARAGDLDDMVTQVITATVGMTINCARCHDHKLDPISQREYYGLWSVFSGVHRGERDVNAEETKEHAAKVAPWNRERADIDRQLGHLADYALDLEDIDWSEAKRLKARRAEVDRQIKAVPLPTKVYAIQSSAPEIVQVLNRGNPETPGDAVVPGAIKWATLPMSFGGQEMTDGQRRLALADWIVDPRNPLTRRVIVNRLWHYHFGQGIVSTPSDFGHGGDRPSHPELLDWLADELLARGWSLKAMHRLIVTSRTYRQSSHYDAKAAAVDAQNRLLWRANPQRLDAESLHDTVLAVSGTLNPSMGGPGYHDFEYTEAYAPIYRYITADRPGLWRRSIYRFVVRTTPQQFLTTLDCPNPANLTPARVTTTTALQALALLNDEFMLKQAGYFAQRVEREAGTDAQTQVRRAFELAFLRPGTDAELSSAEKYCAGHGLAALCRLLLNTNEFVYLD
ncbi:MAG: DUF1549 and DUF1553 domain-containing protein [Chthoniobacter sp.]|nr:DUF1549 and DUF1553 domain-containing protein [Chthoniobacter sp.]